MRFRLQDKTILSIDDANLDLSDYFTNVKLGTSAEDILSEYFKSQFQNQSIEQKFEPIIETFLQMIKQVISDEELRLDEANKQAQIMIEKEEKAKRERLKADGLDPIITVETNDEGIPQLRRIWQDDVVSSLDDFQREEKDDSSVTKASGYHSATKAHSHPLHIQRMKSKNQSKRLLDYQTRLNRARLNQNHQKSNITLLEIFAPDSTTYNTLLTMVQKSPSVTILMDLLKHVDSHYEEIMNAAAIQIPSLSDDSLKLCIEFLSIHHPSRNHKMFKSLPSLVSQHVKGTPLSTLMPKFKVYLDLVDGLNFYQLVDLSKATCYLAIPTLEILVAAKLASVIATMTPNEVRAAFNLPNKCHNPTIRALDSLIVHRDWMSCVERK